MSAPVEF